MKFMVMHKMTEALEKGVWGKHRVIDGPFAESKELIAGYSLLELPSKAAAIEWSVRFGQIVKANEVEVRQLPEW
jgi:hypothetical protein